MSEQQGIVWVICPDYGTEGLGGPIRVYEREADAIDAMDLLACTATSFKCTPVTFIADEAKEAAE